jgi:hypothetical protein
MVLAGPKPGRRIRNLLTEPELQLRLSAPSFQWPLENDAPTWTVQELVADFSGHWRDYRLEAGGSWS